MMKAQIEANKRWREKNPEKFKKITYKSNGKRYLKTYATKEEIRDVIVFCYELLKEVQE